jgi:mediator of RNA polymerase II transcription subunit 14
VFGGADLGSIPFLKIEPGHDPLIICLHNTFVIDPKTGNEAEFVLDQSFIDVECLLLRAISCILHTRFFWKSRECLRVTVSFASMILFYHENNSDMALNKVQREQFDSGSKLTERQISWTQRE